MRSVRRSTARHFFTLAFLLIFRASPAWSAPFLVSSTADAVDATPGDTICDAGGGVCTLRAAIQEANALIGADTITVPAGTYRLSLVGAGEEASATGDLDIAQNLTITGSGPAGTTIDGLTFDRVFDVKVGVTASISSLTIQSGNPGAGRLGGGIMNAGTLQLDDIELVNCTAKQGGGIYSTATSSLTITSSLVRGNSAEDGGGIWIKDTVPGLSLTDVIFSGNSAVKLGGGINSEASTLTASQCLFAGNIADQEGGGVYNRGAALPQSFTNVTFSANKATNIGGGIHSKTGVTTFMNATFTANSAMTAGGIQHGGGTVTLTNTIVANSPSGGECAGTITDGGNNIDSDGSCGVTLTANPLLGPLQDNGGGTFTHALLAGSPAIDAGTSVGAPVVDQRGFGRPVDGDGDLVALWDIGAYELGAVTAVELESFTARRHAGGRVLLRWRTGYETENLGFHLYRETGDQRLRLTPELIAGAALLSRANLTAGRRYAWLDAVDGSVPVRYWLEDVDLDGTRTWHGPVDPVPSSDSTPAWKTSTLLSTLGRKTQAGYRAFHRAQDLRERLRKHPVRPFRSRGRKEAGGRSLAGKLSGPPAVDTGRRAPSPFGSRGRQLSLASRAAVKVLVSEEGWYRVGQAELLAAGLDPAVDPRNLRLYAEGREVAMVRRGARDGRLDPGDALEFYGTGLDTPWSETRTYWLAAGKRHGSRVGIRRSRGGARGESSFPATAELKERSLYFAALRNGEAENFFGAIVTPAAATDRIIDVPSPDIAAPADAFLEVTLQGVTEGAHLVRVLLNDVPLGEVSFVDLEQGRSLFRLPMAGLLEGANLVTLESLGGESDVSLVDVIRLTYRRLYRAEDGRLQFLARGGTCVVIDGFESPEIRVVDVTDPSKVRELQGRVGREGAGYSTHVTVPGRGERRLLAFTEEGVRAPELLVENLLSFWPKERAGADVVMISHRDFLGALEPLATRREAQGYSVVMVDVENLYDEFNYGSKSPWAIRDFLRRAYESWATPPSHVLLVGDATFDPRDYLGFGDLDFLPTKLVETAYLETASDDWFGDFNDDGLAEVAFGRLPVRTVEEAVAVIAKILAQEGASFSTGSALMVADESEGFDFEAACREVSTLLPTTMPVMEVFRGDMGTTAARDELLSRLQLGPTLVTYFGHGTIGMWRDGLFDNADASALSSPDPLPFFVNMTCLNGIFHDLYSERSLAEELLLNPGGGAAAVWASSGLTGPGPQLMMAKELARLLNGSEVMTLGEAVLGAKTAVSDIDVRRTWVLFGDPTMTVR